MKVCLLSPAAFRGGLVGFAGVAGAVVAPLAIRPGLEGTHTGRNLLRSTPCGAGAKAVCSG